MKKRQLKSLPVLMHHLISNDTSHLSVRPAIFEEQCRSLAEKGWFEGLHDSLKRRLSASRSPLWLTLPEQSFAETEADR